jgi:hypothetical protein
MSDDRASIDDLLATEGENKPEATFNDGVSNKEATERRVLLSRLLAGAYSSDEIYAVMIEKHPNMTPKQVDQLELALYRQWDHEDTRRSRYFKNAARRRIADHVRAARKAGNWSAVMSGERLLASIEGTNAPIEVHTRAHVTHDNAVTTVLGEYTQEELRAFVASERALLADGRVIEEDDLPALPPKPDESL